MTVAAAELTRVRIVKRTELHPQDVGNGAGFAAVFVDKIGQVLRFYDYGAVSISEIAIWPTYKAAVEELEKTGRYTVIPGDT